MIYRCLWIYTWYPGFSFARVGQTKSTEVQVATRNILGKSQSEKQELISFNSETKYFHIVMPHLRQARNKHTASERVRVVRTTDRQTACHATLLTNRCSSLCFLLFPSCIVFRTCTRRNRSPYSRSLSLSIYLESNCLPISPNLIPKLSFRLLYRLTSWLTAGFTHSTIFFFLVTNLSLLSYMARVNHPSQRWLFGISICEKCVYNVQFIERNEQK